MSASEEGDIHGRVTTREFYDALLKTNQRMDDMEQRVITRMDRIVDRLDKINYEGMPHVKILDRKLDIEIASTKACLKEVSDDIVDLRIKSNRMDGIVSAAAAIFATIAAYLGVRQ